MELTPIKMRGKGPRKTGYKQPNPKRQKPDKNGSDSDVAVFKKGSAAPIEYLPTEILHRIHLFSRENNLPRASLRIGKVLSHPSFHADLVFQAFAPTWDVWYGCRRDRVRSYDGWYQDVERFGGDPDLQVRLISVIIVSNISTHSLVDRLANLYLYYPEQGYCLTLHDSANRGLCHGHVGAEARRRSPLSTRE